MKTHYPSPHPAAISAERLLEQCDIAFTRRSGPGGQHRNKVSTAVVLKHRPTGLTAEGSERRSQAENRTVALLRLRVELALTIRGSYHPGDGPSLLWRSRCHGGRIEINPAHEDFPAILAESLDVLAESDYDIKPAALELGCTSSQLLKLLKKEPAALALVNRQRQRIGRRPFH